MVYDAHTMCTVVNLIVRLRDQRRAKFNRVIRKHLARGMSAPAAVLQARVDLATPRQYEHCSVFPFRSRA